MTAPAIARDRLTPERLRRLLAFLEEIEQHPVFEKALIICGYFEAFCRATALLRAHETELSLGLAARDVKRRPVGQPGA